MESSNTNPDDTPVVTSDSSTDTSDCSMINLEGQLNQPEPGPSTSQDYNFNMEDFENEFSAWTHSAEEKLMNDALTAIEEECEQQEMQVIADELQVDSELGELHQKVSEFLHERLCEMENISNTLIELQAQLQLEESELELDYDLDENLEEENEPEEEIEN